MKDYSRKSYLVDTPYSLDKGFDVGRLFTNPNVREHIEKWRHSQDKASIDGGKIYARSIEATAIKAYTFTFDKTGYIRSFGKNDYADTTAGFFVGYDTDAYKFYIGDGVDDYLQYDGTNVNASFGSGGGITIKSGGDITLESVTGGGTGYSVFEGDSRTYKMGVDFDNDIWAFFSDTTGLGSVYFGWDIAGGAVRRLGVFTVDSENITLRSTNVGGSTSNINVSATDIIVYTDAGNNFRPSVDNRTASGKASSSWKDVFTYVITLAETTTPTAVTNYGKVYTKSDNKLYFQDGAGTEHEVAFV